MLHPTAILVGFLTGIMIALLLQMSPVQAQITDRSAAWLQGYADGQACVIPCALTNPYPIPTPTEQPDSETREQIATDNADYLGGFIAGKSAK